MMQQAQCKQFNKHTCNNRNEYMSNSILNMLKGNCLITENRQDIPRTTEKRRKQAWNDREQMSSTL